MPLTLRWQKNFAEEVLLHKKWCKKNFLIRGLEYGEDFRATINPALKDFFASSSTVLLSATLTRALFAAFDVRQPAKGFHLLGDGFIVP